MAGLLTSEVLDEAALLLNDAAKVTFGYTTTAPWLRRAINALSDELAVNGIKLLEKRSIVTPVTTTATTITCPSDCLVPSKLEERALGSSDQFIDMLEVASLPTDQQAGTSLVYWAFQGTLSNSVPVLDTLIAQSNREVRITYERFLPYAGVIDGSTDLGASFTWQSKRFLAATIAKDISNFVLKDDKRAKNAQNDADLAIHRIKQVWIRKMQNTPIRRGMHDRKAIQPTDFPAFGVGSSGSSGGTSTVTTSTLFFNVKNYGAVGDGVTDDSLAIGSAVTALNAALGGTLYFPPGTYIVKPTKITYPTTTAEVLARVTYLFNSLKNVTIWCDGALIKDPNVYVGSESALLFTFQACVGVNIYAKIQTQVFGGNDKRGLNIFTFVQGCFNVNVDAYINGGIGGVWNYRQPGESSSWTSRLFRVKLYALDVEYPILFENSGDESIVQLYAELCGRSFFIHGVKNIKIQLHTLNPQSQCLIGAFGGNGCENIDIDYYDRDSNNCVSSSPLISIQYNDTTPAIMRNIKIVFDVKANVTLPWNDTFRIVKLDGAGSNDNTGRGHILDGLDISGLMEQQNKYNILGNGLGNFTNPDIQRNINIHDLTMTVSGGNGLDINLGALTDIAKVDKVNASACEIYMRNGALGRVVYRSCNASNFTSGTANTDVHTYDGTNETAPQSKLNKTLINATRGTGGTQRQIDNPVGSIILISQLANNGKNSVVEAGNPDADGFLFVLGDSGECAIFLLEGTAHATALVSDPTGTFSVTSGTAAKTNVYWNGAKYELENKRGATRDYQCQCISRSF